MERRPCLHELLDYVPLTTHPSKKRSLRLPDSRGGEQTVRTGVQTAGCTLRRGRGCARLQSERPPGRAGAGAPYFLVGSGHRNSAHAAARAPPESLSARLPTGRFAPGPMCQRCHDVPLGVAVRHASRRPTAAARPTAGRSANRRLRLARSVIPRAAPRRLDGKVNPYLYPVPSRGPSRRGLVHFSASKPSQATTRRPKTCT